MADPRAALQRLVEAAASGRLDALCERHHVRIMGAFGSATDPDVEDPHDLDVAVAFEPEHRGDALTLWSDLQDLCGPVELDVMDLDRARGRWPARTASWEYRCMSGVRVSWRGNRPSR